MEQNENKAVVTFDTLYTSNHIQILKILLPYFDVKSRKNLAIMIKFMELRYTMEYFNRHTAFLDAASSDESNGARQPDIIEIFEQIKNFCTPSERAMFDQLANMKRSMDMYEEMMGMMQLFNQFAPDADSFPENGPAQDRAYDSDKGQTEVHDSDANGERTNRSASDPENPSPDLTGNLFGNANPMDMLKGMLSPEQQAMFEMFQSSFGNNGN